MGVTNELEKAKEPLEPTYQKKMGREDSDSKQNGGYECRNGGGVVFKNI